MNSALAGVRAVAIVCSLGLARPALGQDPARHADLPLPLRQVWGIVLGRDNLGTSYSRLGPAATWHTGDAGDSRLWWCYRTGGASGVRVTLSSGGEMGTTRHIIDQIDIARDPDPDTSSQHCRTARRKDTGTPGGLRLGMSRTSLVSLLGATAGSDPDSVSYAWETRRTLSTKEPGYRVWARRTECFGGQAPYADVGASIIARFSRDTLYSFTISRTETMC